MIVADAQCFGARAFCHVDPGVGDPVRRLAEATARAYLKKQHQEAIR